MLLALTEGERHGYALKREILQRTDGKLNLGAGALYGSINRMLEQAPKIYGERVDLAVLRSTCY